MEKDGQKRWKCVQIEDVIFILQMDFKARRSVRGAPPSSAMSSDQGPRLKMGQGRADWDFGSSPKVDPGATGLDDWRRVHNSCRADSGGNRLGDRRRRNRLTSRMGIDGDR